MSTFGSGDNFVGSTKGPNDVGNGNSFVNSGKVTGEAGQTGTGATSRYNGPTPSQKYTTVRDNMNDVNSSLSSGDAYAATVKKARYGATLDTENSNG